MPWMQSGAGALNQINALLGLAPVSGVNPAAMQTGGGLPALGGPSLGQLLQSGQGGSQGNFDSAAYLRANPDVARDPYWSQHPYQHYIEHGMAEGRKAPMTGGSTPAQPVNATAAAKNAF